MAPQPHARRGLGLRRSTVGLRTAVAPPTLGSTMARFCGERNGDAADVVRE
jgi:hypothetical protein